MCVAYRAEKRGRSGDSNSSRPFEHCRVPSEVASSIRSPGRQEEAHEAQQSGFDNQKACLKPPRCSHEGQTHVPPAGNTLFSTALDVTGHVCSRVPSPLSSPPIPQSAVVAASAVLRRAACQRGRARHRRGAVPATAFSWPQRRESLTETPGRAWQCRTPSLC